MAAADPVEPVLNRGPAGRRLIAIDSVAAVAYALVLTGVVAVAEGDHVDARIALAAAIALPLAVRRIWPWPVFATVLTATVAAIALGVVRDPFLAAGLALYPIAVEGTRRRREPLLAVGIACGLVILCSIAVGSRTWWLADYGVLVLGAAVLGAAWTAGRAVRERRAYAARTVAQIADRAVADERLRIARELHDVVAHSMGVIAVKAGVANHVVEARPQEAREALRVIEATSRSAMVELRYMLGVLRAEGEDDPRAPAPDLSGLPDLVERARLAGVPVELKVSTVDALPEGVGLAAYRIVQEALTNVVKHAAPARCGVRIDDDGRRVRIEVTDDGPGRRVPPTSPGGHGMLGMRERVAVYGGEFSAGPLPGGGFRVLATLPYAGPDDGRRGP